MVYQRILLPLAALTMFCLRRKNQLCQLWSANHNSLCPTPPCSPPLRLCQSVSLELRLPPLAACWHYLAPGAGGTAFLLSPRSLSSATAPTLQPQVKEVIAWGIPPPFGNRSQWVGKYPCLLEQFKGHSRCFQGGPSRIKLPLPIAMTWFMCP